MEKTKESTALKTDDTDNKGTVVLLQTVLTPDKKTKAAKTERPPDSKPDVKTEPDKSEKSTDKPKAVKKSVKEEKSDSKSDKKPKTTTAAKPDPQSDKKSEPTTATKPDSKSKKKTEQDKAEKTVVKPDIETTQTDTEKADTKPESVTEQNPTVPNPPAVTKQSNTPEVVDSPLKMMKQEFSERTNVIRQEIKNIQNSFLVIGFQLHWIHRNKMYRILDYKNIYDYAEQEYSIKKSTCGNLINIIEHFAERDANGEVIESIIKCWSNYTYSQLLSLIGMPEEIQQQVTPDMSVREIQRLRKSGQEPKPADEPDAAVTNTNKEETAPVQKPSTTASPPPASETPATTSIVPEKETTASKPTMENKEMPKNTEQMNEESKVSVDNTAKESGKPEESVPENSNTLLEIDSYNDYQKMTDKLDIMMKHVFSGKDDVRVKILCVRG